MSVGGRDVSRTFAEMAVKLAVRDLARRKANALPAHPLSCSDLQPDALHARSATVDLAPPNPVDTIPMTTEAQFRDCRRCQIRTHTGDKPRTRLGRAGARKEAQDRCRTEAAKSCTASPKVLHSYKLGT